MPKFALGNWKLKLEQIGLNPAYSGWLVAGLGAFFFAAATNTLAGWLYLMSGVMIAILAIALVLVRRSLDGLAVERSPLAPTSAGTPISIVLTVQNRRRQPSWPMQVIDAWPSPLGPSATAAMGPIQGYGSVRCTYQTTASRGLYRWQHAALRTAAPLGLIWYRRRYSCPARLIVYPKIIPLARCPALDNLASLDRREQMTHRQRRTRLDTTGTMRSLRPYRWGDPLRLVHWRSSARYGQLRTREMEDSFSQRQVTVALDQSDWHLDHFEQAVTVAASLLQYGLAHQIDVHLWTAQTGRVTGFTAIMTVLAQTQAEASALQSETKKARPAELPGAYVGLTAQQPRFSQQRSADIALAWIVWPAASSGSASSVGRFAEASEHAASAPVLQIQPDQPLQPQLQRG